METPKMIFKFSAIKQKPTVTINKQIKKFTHTSEVMLTNLLNFIQPLNQVGRLEVMASSKPNFMSFSIISFSL